METAAAARTDGGGWTPTAEQSAVLAAGERSVLVEAGAGSGKTGTLSRLYLDTVIGGSSTSSILAFTFTRRAAAELRQRIAAGLARAAAEAADPDEARRLGTESQAMGSAWVTTIHAFCQRMLGSSSLRAGLDPRFRVLDERQAPMLLREAFERALDELLSEGLAGLAELVAIERREALRGQVLAVHELLRSRGASSPRLPQPDEVLLRDPATGEKVEAPAPAQLDRVRREHAALSALLERTGSLYRRAKRERSALDFTDLELHAVELLRERPEVSAEWSERFGLILVDEFQDTNPLQLELLEALHGSAGRLVMVGDELQSIYRFRHADVDVFRGRRDQLGGERQGSVLGLRGNFRSTPAVLATVNALGAGMLEGFKELAVPDPPPDGGGPSPELIVVRCDARELGDAGRWSSHASLLGVREGDSANQAAEALSVARRLRELVDDPAAGVERGDIAILTRTRGPFEILRDALERYGLNPFLGGGRGYWSSQQVEDALSLLSVLANPLDDLSVLGALASPAAGLSAATLWTLRRAAGRDRSAWPVIERLARGEPAPEGEAGELVARVPRAELEAIERFARRVRDLRPLVNAVPLAELVERTIEAFELDLTSLARDRGEQRLANLRRLITIAADYEAAAGRDLRGFLDNAAQRLSADNEGQAATSAEGHDGVRVMTIHAVKGEEFPVVCVATFSRGLTKKRNPLIQLGAAGEERIGLRLTRMGADPELAWDYPELDERDTEADVAEELRLLYVAMTRARERLIVSGALSDKAHAELAAEKRKPRSPRHSDAAMLRIATALADHGWRGGSGPVAVPPATTVADGAEAPDAQIEVTVVSAGAETALELGKGADGAPQPRQEDAGPYATPVSPPLMDRRPRTTPVGAISYSGLSEYERCGYRFFAERVLGLPALDALPGDPLGLALPGASGRAFGSVVHLALERAARESWRAPRRDELAALLEAHGLGDVDALERAERMIAGWLDSPIRRELESPATRVEAEAPFALEIAGATVRGMIDLLATGGGAPLVVDYKTDRVDGRTIEELGAGYRRQRLVYALAARAADPEAADEHGVRAIHLFLERPDEPVVEVLDADALDAARAELARQVGAIRDGDFVPTGSPSLFVCAGCPAAERLCPVAAWRPGRLGQDAASTEAAGSAEPEDDQGAADGPPRLF